MRIPNAVKTDVIAVLPRKARNVDISDDRTAIEMTLTVLRQGSCPPSPSSTPCNAGDHLAAADLAVAGSHPALAAGAAHPSGAAPHTAAYQDFPKHDMQRD